MIIKGVKDSFVAERNEQRIFWQLLTLKMLFEIKL
jgi:hypothetical protein